jgi:hypothetical protein
MVTKRFSNYTLLYYYSAIPLFYRHFQLVVTFVLPAELSRGDNSNVLASRYVKGPYRLREFEVYMVSVKHGECYFQCLTHSI